MTPPSPNMYVHVRVIHNMIYTIHHMIYCGLSRARRFHTSKKSVLPYARTTPSYSKKLSLYMRVRRLHISRNSRVYIRARRLHPYIQTSVLACARTTPCYFRKSVLVFALAVPLNRIAVPPNRIAGSIKSHCDAPKSHCRTNKSHCRDVFSKILPDPRQLANKLNTGGVDDTWV